MPRKTAFTILLFGAIVLALQYAPEGFRVETFNPQTVLNWTPPELPAILAAIPPPPLVLRPPAVPEIVAVVPHVRTHRRYFIGPRMSLPAPIITGRLIDPSGSLTAFYHALERTQGKEPGAITRVLHYGDSPVTADSITADARSLLQRRFGDAGHGFVLIAKPWAWYNHRGVKLVSHGWKIEPASQTHARDGFHGLGGVNFIGGPSATSTVELPDTHHTHMEVYFVQQPEGGTFTVSAGNTVLGEVNTIAETKAPGFRAFPLPADTKDVTLTVTSGTVRVFGWSFEKNGPGIIYDSLGLNGGQVQVALRYFEPHQWAEELEHENPDLVVINYGTNESVYPAYIDRYYEKELRSLVQRVRSAVPRASVLIMSPMDRGVLADGKIVTPEVLPRIVSIQAKVAMETGCAFFNTFEAMGGAGTMAKWYTSQPRLVSADFIHPLPGGAAIVGRLLDAALIDGFERFQRLRMQAQAEGLGY